MFKEYAESQIRMERSLPGFHHLSTTISVIIFMVPSQKSELRGGLQKELYGSGLFGAGLIVGFLGRFL